jgi:hypothetical protein
MSDWDQKIALATRNVEEARNIVERQRDHIAKGHGGPTAEKLLAIYEQSLLLLEEDLEGLLKERESDTR